MKLTLKLWRLKAGYTQAEVAKILKISPATLIKWEKGETQPRIDTLMALCKLYSNATNYCGCRRKSGIPGRHIQKAEDPAHG